MLRPLSIPPVAVTLSYFNKIIGPSTLYVYPRDVVQDEVIKEVTSVIDKVTTPGFFTQSSDNYTAVNDYFEIPSPWARGAKELVLLSFIFPSKVTLDVELTFQRLAQDIEQQIMQTPEIYKGFYNNDAEKYPEGDRAAIREMHQQLLTLVTHLHHVANESLFDTWMLQKSEELLPDSLVNNPILTATCTGYGRDILAAVAQGAKTREEATKRIGMNVVEIEQRLPLLVSLDLLTEGSELVLTNRGRKILQEFAKQDSLADTSIQPLLMKKKEEKIYCVISAIKEGARTLEELHSALQNNLRMSTSFSPAIPHWI